MIDFRNLLGPSMLKICPTCGGRGKLPMAPWIGCEPCDGSGWLPNAAGRAPLDLLGDGLIRIIPPAPSGR